MAREHGPRDGDAARTSVAAHGMLNSLGVARATVATLRLHWTAIDEVTREDLLRRADDHLAGLSEMLFGLVRGIPLETSVATDDLDGVSGS